MIAYNERRVSWLTIGLVILAVIILIGALLAALAFSGPTFGMGPGAYPVIFWGWGAMIAMMIVLLLFWLLIIGGIIALVVWAIRTFGPRLGRHEDEALAILDQRFARGEIDHEEYTMRRHELLQQRP